MAVHFATGLREDDGAAEIANLSVSMARTRFIAPAPDSLMEYVAPPKFPASFPFREGKNSQVIYATLYSLITVVEEIEMLVSEGKVNRSEWEPLRADHVTRYQHFLKTANFTEHDVHEFCDSCNLPRSFCFEYLKPARPNQDPRLETVATVGSQLTTLRDHCTPQVSSTYSGVQQTVVQLQYSVLLLRLIPSIQQQINMILDEWVKLCAAHGSTEALTPADKAKLVQDVAKLAGLLDKLNQKFA
jgi:hypothetical protein